MGGKADARSGVPSCRLGQNLFLWDFRQLADNLVPQVIVRENPYPLRRQYRPESVNSLLDQ
jgi:hypothetical protein